MPNKSRYALIDKVLGRKTSSTEDLYDFCIMMFNSNKEKYQALNLQPEINERLVKLSEVAFSKIQIQKRWVFLLWLAVLVNFMFSLIVLGLVRK